MDKKNIFIFILVVVIVLLIGVIFLQRRNNIKNNKYVNNENVSSIEEIDNVKIEIQLDTVTKSGLTIIVTDNNKESYVWGEEYEIQENVNGEWKTLSSKISSYIDYSDAIGLDENNQFEQKINWTNIYGKLSKGVYRIVKDVDDGKVKDVDDKRKVVYSNEFEIK